MSRPSSLHISAALIFIFLIYILVVGHSPTGGVSPAVEISDLPDVHWMASDAFLDESSNDVFNPKVDIDPTAWRSSLLAKATQAASPTSTQEKASLQTANVQEDEKAPHFDIIDEVWTGRDTRQKHKPSFSTKPTIGKVSMLYGQNPHPAYVRALHSHRIHNERFNYDMFVLEEDAVGGFWNKPLYLLSLLMQELAKPPSQRLQWLMWIDADLILVNPSIPLEDFLPPVDLADSIHFIGGRDQNGLNTGTFFMRVSPWSVHFLNKAIGIPLYHPEINLGNSFDQVAMSVVLSEDKGHEDSVKGLETADETSRERNKRLAGVVRPFIFQPREWYNTYEFDHGYEGGDPHAGHLLVHFPGLEDRRWKHMETWLLELANNQKEYDVAFKDSIYAKQIQEYWDLVRESRNLIRSANETLADLPLDTAHYSRLREAANLCESPLTNSSYDIGPGQDLLLRMKQGTVALHEALESQEVYHGNNDVTTASPVDPSDEEE